MIKVIKSPHFSSPKKQPRDISTIIIHTAECSEIPSSATNIAMWFQNPKSKVSAHYCVSDREIVQCVRDEKIAWHAGPANSYSIGIEIAGRAAQTEAQWKDTFSAAAMNLTAKLVADLCRKYLIPVRKLAPKEVGIVRGICGHVDVTKFLGGSHTDPGVNFPWEEFLKLVVSY